MKIALWGLVLVVVIVVGGVFVYRSTAPNGDVVPEGEGVLQDTSGPADGQFLQLEPDEVSPVGGADVMEDKKDGASDTEEAAAVATTAPAAGGETVTISMTDTGFVPATVTITAGTTVKFLNNGQAAHWPASFVHPVHTVLPAFDSKVGVATGADYSFTFNQTGAWNFHDHLNPTFLGTITVE